MDNQDLLDVREQAVEERLAPDLYGFRDERGFAAGVGAYAIGGRGM